MRQWLANNIPKGSLVLMVTTLGSYVLGLLRDRIFAHLFGASAQLDSYNAAFLLPDFFFNLLVASGIAAAVVPLFTQLYRRKPDAAYAYLNAVMAAAVGVMAVTGIVILFTAPLLARLVAPGLAVADQAVVAHLMRILAISPLLFGASNALGAMLVAKRRFLFYGLSPIFYNAGIIGGALLLTPQHGILGAAYGTVIGAFLHLLVRAADAVWSGWPWRRLQPLSPQELRATLRLMLPKMVGHPVELVTFWVLTAVASLGAAGSITSLNFARNFQSVPVSIIGIAMATAVFPALAEASLESGFKLRRLLSRSAMIIGLATAGAAVLMFVIRRPLIQLLLGGGAFDAVAVDRTALLLGVFCLAIPTESMSHLFARAFYATKNTTIPVVFSVVSLVITAAGAYFFFPVWGLVSLPLGFFLGSLVKTVGLWVALQARFNRQ